VVESTAATLGHISEGKPLVLLQVNCRSICNKALEFWNLIDTVMPARVSSFWLNCTLAVERKCCDISSGLAL
jgi:hypothetical protein